MAYDAAIEQKNPDVATILHVSGIEALLSPDTSWRKARTTKRFVKGCLDYASSAVDEILSHGNLAAAIGFRPQGGRARQRKELLERIYELRSAPVHSGPELALTGMKLEPDKGSMRSALLSELHAAVILSYLQAPRSFLIGHPEIAPGDPRRDS